jgi:hypothetical protein
MRIQQLACLEKLKPYDQVIQKFESKCEAEVKE